MYDRAQTSIFHDLLSHWNHTGLVGREFKCEAMKFLLLVKTPPWTGPSQRTGGEKSPVVPVPAKAISHLLLSDRSWSDASVTTSRSHLTWYSYRQVPSGHFSHSSVHTHTHASVTLPHIRTYITYPCWKCTFDINRRIELMLTAPRVASALQADTYRIGNAVCVGGPSHILRWLQR